MSRWYSSDWSGKYNPPADAVAVEFSGGGPLDGRSGHARDALSALWVAVVAGRTIVRSSKTEPRDVPVGYALNGRYVLDVSDIRENPDVVARSMRWHPLETEAGTVRRSPVVTLRPLDPSDAGSEWLAAVNVRPGVVARLGGGRQGIAIDPNDENAPPLFAIELGGEGVGVVGWVPSGVEVGAVELLTAVTKDVEGKGVAYDACRQVIRVAPAGKTLLATTQVNNVRAERLAGRLGFRYAGRRAARLMPGQPAENVWRYAPRSVAFGESWGDVEPRRSVVQRFRDVVAQWWAQGAR